MNRRDLVIQYAGGGRILDIGCGDALFIWNNHPPQNVYCLDLDIYRHSTVQASAEYLPFRQSLDWNSKTFDTCLLLEVLEHVDDVDKALQDASFVCKSLIISYPNEPWEKIHHDVERAKQLIEFEKQYGLKEYLDILKLHAHLKKSHEIVADLFDILTWCHDKVFDLKDEYYEGWGFWCKYSMRKDSSMSFQFYESHFSRIIPRIYGCDEKCWRVILEKYVNLEQWV